MSFLRNLCVGVRMPGAISIVLFAGSWRQRRSEVRKPRKYLEENAAAARSSHSTDRNRRLTARRGEYGEHRSLNAENSESRSFTPSRFAPANLPWTRGWKLPCFLRRSDSGSPTTWFRCNHL